MQLAKARVRNFRSLRDISIDFGSHTALIGGNGAGKSCVLRALEKFYSTSRTLDADDYFGRNQTEPVEIELTFSKLSLAEHDTFAARVRGGELVVTRVFDTSASSGRYYGSVLQNPDLVAIRTQSGAAAKRDAYKQFKTAHPDDDDLQSANSAQAAEEAMLSWEQKNPDKLVLERDDGQFFGFQNASRGALQRYTNFVFIPAVREASIDAIDGKTSNIGKLLELVVRSSILNRADVQKFKADVTAQYQELVSHENMPELGALAENLTIDLRNLYQEAAVGLNWREVAEYPVPLPIADVSLSDDGFGGPVDRQGHGLQRAFIFTLLQYLAKKSSTTLDDSDDDDNNFAQKSPNAAPLAPSLIIAIEEPELYQHPTKQRHFAEVLRNLSEGSLPGADGPTQIVFASHSPIFVSMERAGEIRLIKRASCDDTDYKQCELKALDLANVASKLAVAWGKPPGSFTAGSLLPRLHILGTELSEGFFANGIVLVEGRSDKAALSAMAQLLEINFESAGIAVLSAEGKPNLDRPLTIFRELGIPTYVVWDCDKDVKDDKGKKDIKAAANLALLRLCKPLETEFGPVDCTAIGDCYAHFEHTLETTIIEELTKELHSQCLTYACEPYGIPPSRDSQKVPAIMFRVLTKAKSSNAKLEKMTELTKAIWLHLRKESLD